MDPSLDSGKFPGRNELGKALNRVKDTLLAQRTVTMTDTMGQTMEHMAPHTSVVGEPPLEPAPKRAVASHETTTTTREVAVSSGNTNQQEKDERAPPHLKRREAHSYEIEVLEIDIPPSTVRTERVWEPTIVLKEGTIVV